MEQGMKPVCVTIGGSDCCGGAGVQADLRVFDALGVHGCSAVTALTAQNPLAITRIEPVSLAQLDAEIHALFDYYDVAVVKTGMLLDAGHIALVSALLAELHQGVLVIDPVLVSSSGKELLAPGAVDTLVHSLIPQASLITPNFDEADVLLGNTTKHGGATARALAEQLNCAVLLTGGHGEAEQLTDRLWDNDGILHEFTHTRQAWSRDQCHGTGCRLASAISAKLAHGKPLPQSVDQAIAYLQG